MSSKELGIRTLKFIAVVLLMAIGLTMQDLGHDWKHHWSALFFLVVAIGLASRWGIPNIFAWGGILKRED